MDCGCVFKATNKSLLGYENIVPRLERSIVDNGREIKRQKLFINKGFYMKTENLE